VLPFDTPSPLPFPTPTSGPIFYIQKSSTLAKANEIKSVVLLGTSWGTPWEQKRSTNTPCSLPLPNPKAGMRVKKSHWPHENYGPKLRARHHFKSLANGRKGSYGCILVVPCVAIHTIVGK